MAHYLIVYDIASPKRLRRIAGACLDGGFRVQRSVFECALPEVDFERLWSRLCALIDPGEDTLLAYPLCGACRARVRSAGRPRGLGPGQSVFLF